MNDKIPNLNKAVEKAFGRAPIYYSYEFQGAQEDGPKSQHCDLAGLEPKFSETDLKLWYNYNNDTSQEAGFVIRKPLIHYLEKLQVILQQFKDCRLFFAKQKHEVSDSLSFETEYKTTYIVNHVYIHGYESQKKLDNFVKTAREFLLTEIERGRRNERS